jgi:hypothetical protein
MKPIGSRDTASGDVAWYIPSGLAGYHTLCSVSLNDDCFASVEPGRGQKVNCPDCKAIWSAARLVKPSDFVQPNTTNDRPVALDDADYF